ncbi:hypothetical protein BJV78DRAFT_1231255 [Lactifluus subvellereus]|nr:hypothetical protein BJV78DRAFT_1231255 [Lactifluus subvellereus]
MTWLSTARLVTFVTTILFSIIVMALSAALIVQTEPNFYWKFSALALGTGLLTVITIVPIFIIDMLRKGTFFSYIAVEIVWLKVLWVLWLSSASYAAWTDAQITSVAPEESTCNFSIFGECIPPYMAFNIQSELLLPDVDGASLRLGCGEIKAIKAFSFLSWILRNSSSCVTQVSDRIAT